MTMSITELLIAPGPTIYYSAGFRLTLETHMRYLREHSRTQRLALTPHDVYKFEGDLNGLLRKYNVPTYLHWVIMRMNHYTGFNQVDSSLTYLLVPDQTVVDGIRQHYETTLKK